MQTQKSRLLKGAITLLLFNFLFIYCSKKPVQSVPLTTVVMMTTLVPDSAVYHFYDSLHSSTGVWPALKKANELSGIKEIKIYRFEDKVVMEYSYPEGADLAKMDSLYLSSDSSVKIWNQMMSNIQRALPGVDSTKKWTKMNLIHHYSNGNYLK
ncbi:MAG: L-rhamnose mutarotase [Sediminibacterium sp.]